LEEEMTSRFQFMWRFFGAIACFAVFAIITLIVCVSVRAAPLHCNQNLVRHSYKAQVYHHQAAQVLYLVAPEIRYEAIVEKKLRAHPDYEAFREFQAFKAAQQSQQPPEQPWKSLATGQPVAGSLPDGTPDLIIKTKCAACHGPDAELVLDGSRYISAATYQRFSEMALTGHDVPAKMKPVLAKMQGDDLTNVLVELLRLKEPAPTAADTEPEEDEPGVLK
jgi:hypothetical protein